MSAMSLLVPPTSSVSRFGRWADSESATPAITPAAMPEMAVEIGTSSAVSTVITCPADDMTSTSWSQPISSRWLRREPR
jgi:hypothetical protein